MAALNLAELGTIENSENRLRVLVPKNEVSYKYYYQNLVTKDLGIGTPPRLKGLNTVLGWATSSVDVLQERIFWRGFWSPENTNSETTEWLNSLYRENFMEVGQKAHQRDGFVTGAAYLSVMPGDVEAGEGEILWRSESPNNTYGAYNHRKMILENCFKISKVNGEYIGVLWLPNSTITVKKKNRNDNWLFHSRDDHELGAVTVVPIINNSDTIYPRGRSEISRSLRGYVDSGMRTLLGTELAREFFAQPLRALLGADKADFVNEDGTPMNVWDLITGKVINVPYNTKDNILPQLLQLTPSNPQNIMQLIQDYAKLAAREIGVPPSYFGFETTNPSSADAINEADKKLIHKANTRIPALKQAYKQAANFSLLLSGREKPTDWSTLEAIFMRTETPTPQASADRIVKMSSMGLFEKEYPTWVYRELGLSEVEIKETQEFLRNAAGTSLVEQLIQANTNVGATPTGA